MKRSIVCGFILLSFFGLMIFARNGGGGGRSGGGRMGGGSVGRSSFSGGRMSGRTSVPGTTRISGGTRVSPTTRVAGSTRVSPTTRVSGTTRVGRSGSRFSGGRGGRRWHGHGHRSFRRDWSGPIFWNTGLYPYFYDYCDANPWDERCYDDYYDDYVEPGIGFSVGF